MDRKQYKTQTLKTQNIYWHVGKIHNIITILTIHTHTPDNLHWLYDDIQQINSLANKWLFTFNLAKTESMLIS